MQKRRTGVALSPRYDPRKRKYTVPFLQPLLGFFGILKVWFITQMLSLIQRRQTGEKGVWPRGWVRKQGTGYPVLYLDHKSSSCRWQAAQSQGEHWGEVYTEVDFSPEGIVRSLRLFSAPGHRSEEIKMRQTEKMKKEKIIAKIQLSTGHTLRLPPNLLENHWQD